MGKELSQGIRKYIRRQKMIIKRIAKTKDEESRLIRELLSRFYVHPVSSETPPPTEDTAMLHKQDKNDRKEKKEA